MARNFYRDKDNQERQERIDRQHIDNRLNAESRYPYTAKLSLPEIMCLRDTNAGMRVLPSVCASKGSYARTFTKELGWDQMRHRCDRLNRRQVQLSARKEDNYRVIPQEINSDYGKHQSAFYDSLNLLCPLKYYLTTEFYTVNTIPGLPPISGTAHTITPGRL